MPQICLRDGRQLAIAEHGDPDGRPVVYFPGLGQDRTACARVAGPARMIVADRPGLGASDPSPARRIEDFVCDLSEALDELAVDRFSVLAWSAGAAYALACCAAMPERITAATIVAPMAPPELRISGTGSDVFARGMLALARRSPALVAPPLFALRLGAQAQREFLMRALYANAPSCDKRVLSDPEIRRLFKDTYRSATRGGAEGLITEVALLARPWHLDLSTVRASALRLVHGTEDRLTPPLIGRTLHASLSGSLYSEFDGHGHMVIYSLWDALLRDLLHRAGASRDAVLAA